MGAEHIRTLVEICQDNQCETDKSAQFLELYDRTFSSIRFRPIVLLELGVANGASLRLWKEYFPHAKIIGIDHKLTNVDLAGQDIQLYLCEQDDEIGLRSIARSVAPSGSHGATGTCFKSTCASSFRAWITKS